MTIAISIHALLAESDHPSAMLFNGRAYFYPRSPCGERLTALHDILKLLPFLSTLSLRRATANAVDQIIPGHISIHALLAESDLTSVVNSTGTTDFYPRSPCGERPDTRPPNLSSISISIHALLAESDAPNQRPCPRSRNFYPRSPCGERQTVSRVFSS